MHTNYDKLNRVSSYGAEFPTEIVKSEISEKTNFAQKTQEIKVNEKIDKKTIKTDEFALLKLHSSSKTTNQPKSMTFHKVNCLNKESAENSLFFIATNLKIFQKFVQSQLKIVDSEIKLERKLKIKEEAWKNLKKEFQKRLKGIKIARKEEMKKKI